MMKKLLWLSPLALAAVLASYQVPAPPLCGNEVTEFPEQCDDGNNINGDGCSSSCTIEQLPACGNGVLEAGEQCDDGNLLNGDGCSASCEFEKPDDGEGCTPGYWKQTQHFDSWTGYAPGTQFSSVFENAFPGKTLVQVLGGGGGSLDALGRHVVAALLNTSSGDVNYGQTQQDIINAFNAVYPGTDAEYEALKNSLAADNERGCPLN
jgi:cysteine-rich repeat protein